MSAADLTDLQLKQLLGEVPPPRPPAGDLAGRIVARALRTSQTRASLFPVRARHGSRRRVRVLSAVIAANIMAAAAVAASWDGQRFDFHRLIDLPQRAASAVHIRQHHRSTHLDEQPHLIPQAAPHLSSVLPMTVTAAPSGPMSAAGRVVVGPATMASAMPPHPRVHVGRSEHLRQLVHLPSVSKHSARPMQSLHLSSQVRVRTQHIASGRFSGRVGREVAPKAQLERTRTISPRATEEREVAPQAAPVQQAAPEIRELNQGIGSNSQWPAAEERARERDRAGPPGTRRRARDRLMFRRDHLGIRRNRMGRRF